MDDIVKSIEPRVGCVQAAMEVIGSKWTALILRDLADCPQRFCSLEKSVCGINPRTLSQRLDQLETGGIIIKSPGGYGLTKKGRDLIPMLKQMAAWGAKYG